MNEPNDNKWIRRVVLKDWQSHSDTDIHFTPGINLVVGTSHIGKSSLLRAINLVLHNQVPNREFVSRGAKNAVVRLEYSDGTVIEREKGETKNSYYLQLPDGTAQTFNRVGTDIPTEVYEAMGRPPVDKYHGPISYAEQMSPLFLVSLTDTQLPRAISHLTGCDDFEVAAAQLGKRAKQFDRDIKTANERLSALEAQMSQYDDLDNKIAICENVGDGISTSESQLELLEEAEELLGTYAEVMSEGKRASEALKKAEATMAFASRVSAVSAKRDVINEAIDLTIQYETIASDMKNAQESLDRVSRVIESDFRSKLNKLDKRVTAVMDAMQLIEEYNEISTLGKEAKTEMDRYKQQHENACSELDVLRAELLVVGAVCDKCGQLLAGDVNA